MKKICLFLFTLFCSINGNYRVELTIDKNSVATNEMARLSVSIVAEKVDLNKVPDPEIDGLTDFRILSQSQSTNISIINGDYQSTKTITYGIMAMKEGVFTVGPAWIQIGREKYESETISIEVTKNRNVQTGQSNQDKLSSEAKKEIRDDKEIFLTAEPEKTKCSIYEPIRIIYKLYTRVAVENFGIVSLPKANNFWLEEDQSRDEIKQYNKTINGHRYLVAELKEVVVFPTESGKLEITPLVITCQVRSRGRDPFDDFFSSSFFARTEKRDLSSSSVFLNVQPLPEEGKPEGFNEGNVGIYSIEGEVNQTEVEANQGITYRLKISGQGNIKLLSEPEIHFPKNMTVYLSNTNDKMSVRNGKVYGEKVIEYALIPTLKGEYIIPEVTLPYYNHINRNYEIARSTPIKITALKSNASGRQYSGFSQSEISILNEDIRYIKPVPNGNLLMNTKFPLWLWFLYLFFIICLPVVITHSRHKKKMLNDKDYARSHSAGKESKTRLKKALALIDQPDEIEYYEELYRAIVKFITDKKAMENHDLDLWEVERMTRENGVEKEKSNEIKEFLEKCQMIRFSPTKSDKKTREEDYRKAKEILEFLNKAFK